MSGPHGPTPGEPGPANPSAGPSAAPSSSTPSTSSSSPPPAPEPATAGTGAAAASGPADAETSAVDAPPPETGSTVWAVLRIVVGLALLGVLASMVPWEDTPEGQPGLKSRFARLEWTWALPAAACFMIPHALVGLRWWALMRAPGIPVTAGSTLKLNFVGALVNNVALGSAGGDLAKAYYVTRHAPGKRPEAVTVIFVDRVVGLIALCILAVSFIGFGGADAKLANAGRVLGIALVAMLAGALVFFSRTIRGSRAFEAVLARLPLADLVRRMDATVRVFRGHLGTVGVALLLSWGGQGLAVLGTYCAAQSVGLHDVSLWKFFAVLPVVWAVSAVPLTPGALGVQEGVFLFFAESLSLSRPDALALSLMFRVFTLLSGLPGAVVLLMGAYHPPEQVGNRKPEVRNAQ